MNLKKTLLALFFISGIFSSCPAHAFRFVVYSDNHLNQDLLRYMNAQITSFAPLPSFVCYLGDMADFPKDDTTNYLGVWKSLMTSTLKGIPYYVCPGNHDVSPTDGLPPSTYDLQLNFQKEFSTMPENGPLPSDDSFPQDFYKHLVYSFECGTGLDRSLFVFLDSYIVTPETPPDNRRYYGDYDGDQVAWFQQQVTSSKALHKFVFAHAPFVSAEGFSPYFDPTTIPVMGLGLNNIRNSCTDVDLLFCGHEHLYSRWSLYPAMPFNALQITTGGAGGALDGFYVPPAAHPFYTYNFVVVDVEGKNVVLNTYGVIDHGNSTFSMKIIDTVKLTK